MGVSVLAYGYACIVYARMFRCLGKTLKLLFPTVYPGEQQWKQFIITKG